MHSSNGNIVIGPRLGLILPVSRAIQKIRPPMGLRVSKPTSLAVRCIQECSDDVLLRSFDDVDEFMVANRIDVVQECGTRGVDIKCIVFENSRTSQIILVVIDQKRKVSLSKIAQIMGIRRQDIAMVPGDLLVSRVGYKRGEIPPFGFPPGCDIVRIIDDRLISETKNVVHFGPPGREVCILAQDLVLNDSVVSVGEENVGDGAASRDDLVSLPEGSDEINLIVHVTRKRKLAKRLVFATVVPCIEGRPVGTAYSIRGRIPKRSIVWKHPQSGEPCELQCIFGKSLEKRYGKSAMEMMLKKVVKGGYLQVSGRVQHSKHTSQNKDSSSVDFIVHDMEQLSSSVLPTLQENGILQPAEVKPPQQYPFRNLSKFKKKGGSRNNLPEYSSSISDVILVKSLEDLSCMVSYFSEALERNNDGQGGLTQDGIHHAKNAHYPDGWKPRMVVSLDAEWRPSMKQGMNNPVSILQLGTRDRAFLIDLLDICFMNRQSNTLTTEQSLLSDFIARLLSNPDIVKLGFGLRYDIKRLCESYHWLPCFSGETQSSILSHVDILMLARISVSSKYGSSPLSSKIGLNTLVSKVLGRSLDKEEQVSDWGARPLTESQIQYAVSDVACLIDIYDTIHEESPGILDGKTMTQCALNLFQIGGSFMNASSSSEHHLAMRGDGHLAQKKRPLTESVCDSNKLKAYTGKYLPLGGKLGVVKACLQEDEADKATALYRIPRGGAMIEMSNAFLMFVNIPSRMYPNTFALYDDGLFRMSWWTSTGQTRSHPVVSRILNREKSMHLFCRKEKDKYVYFGELDIDTESIKEEENGQIKLLFILKDYHCMLSKSPLVSQLMSMIDTSTLSST